ncbi:MAG: hypothetical protein ACRDD8_11910, partial [Bacteroidales bacterium]
GHVGFAKNIKSIKQLVSKVTRLSPYQRELINDWGVGEYLDLDSVVYAYYEIECRESDDIHFSFIWEEDNGADYFEYIINMTLDKYTQKARLSIDGVDTLKPRKFDSFDDVTKIEKFLDLMSVEDIEEDDAYIATEALKPPVFNGCNYESEWI